MSVHTSTNKFNRNTWSALPINTTPKPNNENKWQTQGCASNVFLDNQASSITIYDRFKGVGIKLPGYNMRFEVNAYPKTNDPVQGHPSYNSGDYQMPHCAHSTINNSDCVDCSTDCDRLGIKETGAVGITKLNWEHTPIFSFYPNPTNGVIMISLDPMYYSTSTTISVIDMLGKEVLSRPITSLKENIDLRSMELTNGVYFIKVHSNEACSTAKLIYQSNN